MGLTIFKTVPVPVPCMLPWATGRYYASQFFSGTIAGFSVWSNNAMAFVAIYVPNPAGVTVTSLSIEVGSAAAAGGLARLGLYEFDMVRACPGRLVIDGGTVPIDATGVQTAAVSKFVRQGWYATAFASYYTGSPTVRAQVTGAHLDFIGFPDYWTTSVLHPGWAITVNTGADVNAVNPLPQYCPTIGVPGGSSGPSNSSQIRVLVGV